jgi:hypothetical protein
MVERDRRPSAWVVKSKSCVKRRCLTSSAPTVASSPKAASLDGTFPFADGSRTCLARRGKRAGWSLVEKQPFQDLVLDPSHLNRARPPSQFHHVLAMDICLFPASYRSSYSLVHSVFLSRCACLHLALPRIAYPSTPRPHLRIASHIIR